MATKRKVTEPDIRSHRPDPEYVASLIQACKKRHTLVLQAQVAEMLGVCLSTLKNWKYGKVPIPYHAQYTLERMAGI